MMEKKKSLSDAFIIERVNRALRFVLFIYDQLWFFIYDKYKFIEDGSMQYVFNPEDKTGQTFIDKTSMQEIKQFHL